MISHRKPRHWSVQARQGAAIFFVTAVVVMFVFIAIGMGWWFLP